MLIHSNFLLNVSRYKIGGIMNGNQVDTLTPQIFDLHSEEAETTKYMVVDPTGENLGLTRDKHLASSIRQVHHFVMTHFSQLSAEEIDLLSSNHLEHVFKAKKGLLGTLSNVKKNLSKKVGSAIEFILNLGKTEKTLIKEIQTKLMNEHKICENMVNDFSRELERNGLKEKLEMILVFKIQLESKEKELNKLIDYLSDEQAESLAREVEGIKKELLKHQDVIKPQKMRKQIRSFLKQINVSEDDSCMIQEAKKRFLEEHQVLIQIMQPHIQFHPSSEVRLFSVEQKQSSKRLKINTNFSDRSMKGCQDYYLRAPEDSSVEKLVQPYRKNRV